MRQHDKALGKKHRDNENGLHNLVINELRRARIKLGSEEIYLLCKVCKNAFDGRTRQLLERDENLRASHAAWRAWIKTLITEVQAGGGRRLRRGHIEAIVKGHGGPIIA